MGITPGVAFLSSFKSEKGSVKFFGEGRGKKQVHWLKTEKNYLNNFSQKGKSVWFRVYSSLEEILQILLSSVE